MNRKWKPAFAELDGAWYFLKDMEDLRDKHILILEAMQKDEEEYFWRDLARSNLLVFLYSIGGSSNNSKLREQTERTLTKDKKNITALKVKEQLLKCDRSSGSSQVSHELKQLETDKDEFAVQSIIRSSEIAFAYSYVHPSFYWKAIELYEQVIDHYQSESNLNQVVKERLQGRLCGWYFHLAQTYSRMMNKGQSHILLRKLSTSEVFQEISKRLKYIINENDEHYTGKAMIELVDAFKKCQTAPEGESIVFPIDRDLDHCVLEAMTKSPSDPHVLERCGRHYRQRAFDKESFLEAEKILQRAVHLYPMRHVAWHQLGLVYRSLWLETGGYDEAKMHRNDSRRGKPQGRRLRNNVISKNVNRSVYRESSNKGHHIASALAKESRSEAADNSSEQLAPEFKKSCSLVENPVTEKPVHLRELPQTAPPSLPTLTPKFPTQRGQTPRQSKHPDYYDEYRVKNPLSQEPGSSQFLEKAASCFEEACERSNNTSCRYFIDWCRVLISLGKLREAEEIFLKANDLIELTKIVDHNDRAFFYEQWALFKHKKLHRDLDDYDESIKYVMRLHRDAILAAMIAKIRSKKSFYELRDILEERTKTFPSNEAFRVEYKVLYKTSKKYANEEEALVKCLKNDEDTRKTVLWLTNFLYERKQVNDASVAFFYITALKEAGHFLLDGTADAKGNAIMVVNLVIEMNKERPAYTALTQAFIWLVGDETLQQKGFKAELGHSLNLGPYDACILAPSGDLPFVEYLWGMLKKNLCLRVGRAFVRGDDDITPGHRIHDGLFELISESKFVFIVEDHSDVELWNVLDVVVDAIWRVKNSKACFVATCTNANCSNLTNPRYSERWPRLVVNDKKDCVIYELLKKIADIEV